MNEQATHYPTAEAAEAAFYAAFRRCDTAAIMALWTELEPYCIHPGARPLLGTDAIRRSWEHIFSDAVAPSIRTRLVHRVNGDDLAVHLVEEYIGPADEPAQSAVVLATNIYRRDAQGWQMASHQGSVMPADERPSRLQ